MYEETDDNAKEKYLRAQQSIDVLFHRLSELSSIRDMDTKTVKSWDELKECIVNLQRMLTTLQETREQLIAVNLQVHRFMTEYSTDLNYRNCSLKDDVTELYQRWEDIYEQNGAHLTELQTLNSLWNAFDDKLQSLHKKVKEAENISVKQDCDQVYLQSEESKTEFLQKDLNLLKLDVEFLQSRLTSVNSWESVKHDLQDLEKRIQKQTHTLFASRKVDHSNSSTDEDDPDDQFEDAIQLLESDSCRYKRNKTLSPNHMESNKKDAVNAKRKSSRFGRILRIAVPVQLTLVLLFCLACYLEPNCCDRLNNFNFSFTPHLRYMRGPPPV